MPAWRRPGGPVNVWRLVEGEKKLEDGTRRPLRFSIQEVPEDRREEVLDFMCRYYIVEEPLAKSLCVKDDLKKIHDYCLLWNYSLDQGHAMAAYILDSNDQIGELAAVNMLYVSTEDTDKEIQQLVDKFQSSKVVKLMDMLMKISKKADARVIFDVDKYIAALGLVVAPYLRGQKLGLRMLEARSEMGQKYGIPASSTSFTARASQILAERAGFKEETSLNYDEVFDEDGTFLFPNIETKDVKQMMKRLP